MSRNCEFFGNRQIEAMRFLDGSVGRQIIDHNLHITHEVIAGAFVERFGQPGRSLRGSVVVCLYGKPEYLFLQNAMFAGCPGFEDYELIYVSNSPEMAERLLKEAKAAQQIYGLPQTIVLLPGNAGFGAANNVAVQPCAERSHSDRQSRRVSARSGLGAEAQPGRRGPAAKTKPGSSACRCITTTAP